MQKQTNQPMEPIPLVPAEAKRMAAATDDALLWTQTGFGLAELLEEEEAAEDDDALWEHALQAGFGLAEEGLHALADAAVSTKRKETRTEQRKKRARPLVGGYPPALLHLYMEEHGLPDAESVLAWLAAGAEPPKPKRQKKAIVTQ